MTIDNETKERAKAWQAAQTKKAVEQKEDVAIKPAVVIAPKPTNAQRDYTAAKRIAMKVIEPFEKFVGTAYPDPLSPLYQALSAHNLLRKFMAGECEIPKEWGYLDGSPWTLGFGRTKGVKQGDKCTLEEARNDLIVEVEEVLASVLKSAPDLSKASDEAVAACVSLAYNIGNTAFANSTVVKKIAVNDWQGAGQAFLLFNKGGNPLRIIDGLDKRRHAEMGLFISQTA